MKTLRIKNHDLHNWGRYASTIGFVPDPMILRAGEILLNGCKGTAALRRDPENVWSALRENITGIIEFFDMVVSRDLIPLINYGDTFDRDTTPHPIEELLPDRLCRLEIDYAVYNEIKKGALLSLVAANPEALSPAARLLYECDALRYDWKPELDVADRDPALEHIRPKLAALKGPALTIAQFLLGGLIFSGFAQASDTTHYIQSKRSRFFLGLTAARDVVTNLGNAEEDGIFETAHAQLKTCGAIVQLLEPIPPVLPFLLVQGPEPRDVRELLDRALAFRASRRGIAYREIVGAFRNDGIEARRAANLSLNERRHALELLAPYSRIDPERSRSLEITLSSDLIGVPGVEMSFKVGVPTWLKIWCNDHVPFGGVRKTLRRMWMAADSYEDLSKKLSRVWLKS